MNTIDEIKKTMPLVKDILTKDLEARDNDNLLCFRVWSRQGIEDATTYAAFRSDLFSGKLTQPKTIYRSRRKLQEHHKELRGKTYNARKREEEYIKNQIKLF